VIDFSAVDALTFDCYGTLIDWETGLLRTLGPMVATRGIQVADDRLLETYARHESSLEAGPYVGYKDVLVGSLRGLGAELGFEPTEGEEAAFARSPADWPPFSDSADALARLRERFRLGVITNCDDDLFEESRRRLGADFAWIITAQQARSYKPDAHNFEVAFARITVPRQRIVHVAQSLYHDHVPAKHLGMTTVWVDRRRGRDGFGATPPAEAKPDLVVRDMRELAQMAAG